MSTNDYTQKLNQLAEMIWESEAGLTFKEQEQTPPPPPPKEDPDEVLWGKWGGQYIIVTRCKSGNRVANIKLPEKFSDEASARSAALDLIRKYPQAGIRYLSAQELAVYLL
ncbi:hypothetical protein Misp06_00685 [Microbulbifer sp. NBRC 101763]|uniref:hypothetical protein n=1 Tax=Microbulbifer TaxID=48073 RepID=UPI00035EA55C|nr:hypothetical protein [Microbulbifer variabilis]